VASSIVSSAASAVNASAILLADPVNPRSARLLDAEVRTRDNLSSAAFFHAVTMRTGFPALWNQKGMGVTQCEWVLVRRNVIHP